MKRALSLLVSMLMLATVVFSVPTVSAATETTINQVFIENIAVPVVGSKADVSAVTFRTSPTDKANLKTAYWIEKDTNKHLSASSLFEEGKKYRFEIILTPSEGCKFDFYNDGTFKGSKSVSGFDSDAYKEFGSGGNLQIVTEYVSAFSPEIKSVSISGIEKPVIGEKSPKYDDLKIKTVPENAAKITGFGWFIEGSGWVYASKMEPFEENKSYSPYLVIRPVDGYRFEFDDSDSKNYTGEVAVDNFKLLKSEKNSNSDGALYVRCDYEKAVPTDKISKVEITGIDMPKEGEHPSFTNTDIITVPENSAVITEASWFDITSGKHLTDTDEFEPGGAYAVMLKVRPKDDYQFTFDSTVTHNFTGETIVAGQPAFYSYKHKTDADCLYIESQAMHTMYYVDNITVSDIPQPVAGEKADLSKLKAVSVPEFYANITDAGWYEGDTRLGKNDVFEVGKTYHAEITIEPNLHCGFIFDEETGEYTGTLKTTGADVETPVASEDGKGNISLKTVPVTAIGYQPVTMTDDNFLMYISDLFTISSRGVVFTGKVTNGKLHPGDIINITSYNGTDAVVTQLTVESIEMFGKLLDEAVAGDNIGICVGFPFGKNEDNSINKGPLKIGDVVQGESNNIPAVQGAIMGDFKMYTKDEGGTNSPITQDLKVQAFIGADTVSCTFRDLNGADIQPGTTRENVVIGDFYHSVIVYKGQTITIRNGGVNIGVFTVKDYTVPVTAVNVWGATMPAIGQHPDFSNLKFETFPENAAVMSSSYWVEYDSITALSPSKTFQENTKYYLSCSFKPQPGYRFDGYDNGRRKNAYKGEVTIDKLDLNFAEILDSGNMHFRSISILPTVEIPITSVSIENLKKPYAGDNAKAPDVSLVTVPENAAEIKKVSWYSGGDLDESDVFVSETTYYCYFIIQPKDGYYFDFSDHDHYYGTASISNFDVDCTVKNSDDGSNLYLDTQWFTPQEKIKITNVSIVGVEKPLAGEKVDLSQAKLVTVPENVAKISKIRWCKESSSIELANGEEFAERTSYFLYAKIVPDEGYEFDFDDGYTGEVSISNLSVEKAFEDSIDKGELFVKSYGEKSSDDIPITSVKVTGVKKPVAGEKPDYSNIKVVTVPENAADIVEVFWCKESNYDELSGEEVFVEDEKYYIYFTIRPREGYKFEFDGYDYIGEASIEGLIKYYAEERSGEEGSLYLDCEYVEATTDTRVPITSVNVTGVKKPVIGEKPDYSDIKVVTVPENAADIVEVYWYKESNLDELSEDDVFVKDEKYSIYFTIRPKDGYKFEFDNSSDHTYMSEASIEGFDKMNAEERYNEEGSLYLDCEFLEAEEAPTATDPVYTTAPTTVTDPVDTTAPTTATDPAETTAPTTATDPVETTAPTTVTDPVETTAPTTSTDPVETTAPTTATDPADTTAPTTEPVTTEPVTTDPVAAQPPTTPNFSKTESNITNKDTDKKDVSGSKFSLLQLNVKKTTKTSITIGWTKVKGAKGYYIYGAECGKKMKLLKAVSAKTVKYTASKLKSGKYYKYTVVAYKTVDGKNDVCGISKTIHQATTNTKLGNPSKLTVKKASISLKPKKKYTVKATVKWSKKKYQKHIALVRYESSNTKIATVTSKGVITAKKKGTCYVYAYAQNGTFKKIKVSVK